MSQSSPQRMKMRRRGSNWFDERDREAVKRRAVRRLEMLGYEVELTPSAAQTA